MVANALRHKNKAALSKSLVWDERTLTELRRLRAWMEMNLEGILIT